MNTHPFTAAALARRLMLLLLAGLLLMLVPAPVQAKSWQANPADYVNQLLGEINRVRQENGLLPLVLNQLLVQAAQLHVADMSANHNYSHTGSDGSSVQVRAARANYAGGGGVSENWVAAYDTAGAMAWWMNSSVHRGNILNPKWHEIGIGNAPDPTNDMTIFVLVFGASNNANPSDVVAAVAQPENRPVAPLADGMSYSVRPGDTLSSIATRYGLAWERIADANQLAEFSVLRIGQTLYLPGINDNSAPSPGAAIGGRVGGSGPGYMVQSGDTLVGIAARYGLSWQELAAANGLHETSTLQIGQLLQIPNQVASAAASSTRSLTHTVRSGETIITIALRYDLDWVDLLHLNGLTESSLLTIGQQLRLE